MAGKPDQEINEEKARPTPERPTNPCRSRSIWNNEDLILVISFSRSRLHVSFPYVWVSSFYSAVTS